MFSWYRNTSTWQSPVGDPFNLDFTNRLANGRVDLLMAVSEITDVSPRTLDVIGRKVENYCEFVKSANFQAEFGEPNKDFVTIGIRSDFEIPELVLDHISEVFEKQDPPAELVVFYEYPDPANDWRPAP